MNRENLQNFILFLDKNKEAAAKVQELGGDMEKISAYARSLGYNFTREELEEYEKKIVGLFKAGVEKKLKKEMSADTRPGVETIRQFMLLAETDDALRKKLAEMGTAAPEEIILYGREKGFIFDEKDMDAFAKEIMEVSDELTDEELELAAGGTTIAVVAAGVVVGVILGVFAAGALSAAGGAAGIIAVKLVSKW